MVGVRSRATDVLIAAGSDASSCGSAARTRSTVAMTFAPGLRKITTRIAGWPFEMPPARTSSTESTTSATSESWSGAPFSQATTMGRYCIGGAQLPVGVDLAGHVAVDEPAGRTPHIGSREGLAHVFQPDVVTAEGLRVELHPDGRERAAAHEHLADSLHAGQALLHDARSGIVHLPGAHRVGGEGEDEDGRVGGIHLPIRRVDRQRWRQVGPGGADSGLHVSRRAVDVPVEVELKHDPRRSETARGRHVGNASDAAELALERSRHRAGHGLGARPGQRGGDLDGGEVHLGQRRDRQELEPERTRDGEPDGEQRRRDGPGDERCRDVHDGEAPGSGITLSATPRIRFARRSKAR